MFPFVNVKMNKTVFFNLVHVINVQLIIARRVNFCLFYFFHFYFLLECVKSGPGEECQCEDVNLCVYRPGNCFTRSYYECVPPGKGTNESVDLVSGRALAKKRNYK